MSSLAGPLVSSMTAVLMSADACTIRVTGTITAPDSAGKYSFTDLSDTPIVGSAVSTLMSPRPKVPDTSVPWGSFSSFCPPIRNSTRSTVSNSVRVCTTASTRFASAAASAIDKTSLPRSTRASPPAMSRSMDVFSGSTVRSPSRAACMSLSGDCTIIDSVALAMPSSIGTEHITGTR